MKRIKNILGIILLFIVSCPIIIQAIPQQPKEDVTVTVTTYFSEDNQIHTVLDDFKYGDVLSFDNSLSELAGYEFVFWVVNGVVRSDLDIDNEFIITKDLELVGIFKETGKYSVLFMDTNGKLLDVKYVNPGEDVEEPEIINYPSKPGYIISDDKWNKSLSNITEDTVITLVYEKIIENSYEVKVVSGKIFNTNESSGIFEYNAVVTIEADDAPSGKYFSHWQINNKLVSSKEVYSFTVLEDITIEAIYSDYEKPDIPLIYLSDDLKLRQSYQSYLAQFYLPEGYKLVEYGILTSNNDEVLHLNSSNINRYQGSNYLLKTNEFLMSFSNPDIKSVRAYLVSLDPNGNLVTTYNLKYSETVQGFTISGDFTTPSGKTKAQVDGWGGTGSYRNNYFVLDDPNEYLMSPIFNSSGPLKLDMNIWVSSANGSQTFVIEAYDNQNNLVDSSGNIKLSDTSFGIISQNYTDYSYQFDNVNGNIAYIKFIYNKENNGINLRFSDFSITQLGKNKDVIGIDTFLDKTKFVIDEELDLSKSLLLIYYSDGTFVETKLDESMISGFNTLTSGIKTLNISYNDFVEEIEYEVEKIDPIFTEPDMIVVKYTEGLRLSDLELPAGFSWENSDLILSIGEAEYTVTFTPEELDRYNIVTGIKVRVKVVEEIKEELFIYEVYGGGGNSRAPYQNDFVILYNNSLTNINLDNYSLQYATSSSNYFSGIVKLSGIIKPNNFYVIKLSGGSNGVELPIIANVTGGINANQISGKFGLVQADTTVNVNDDRVIELVEYSGLSSSKSYRLNQDFNNYSVVDVNLNYLYEGKDIVDIDVENLRSNYNLNQELDLLDAKLILIYETGVSINIQLYEYMIEGFNTTNVGIFVLTITYNDIITSFEYIVSDYSSTDDVYIYYIDIGVTGGKAGEAALIKVGETEILIDAGTNDSSSTTELLSFLDLVVFDGVIEYVIATHPDADHIGGMNVVFEEFLIENVIMYSSMSSPTGLRVEFESTVASEGSTVYYISELVSNNRFISLASGVELEFYNTNYLTSSDTNSSSIVFALNAFNTKVLFNGDAERPQELIYGPLVGDVDIFKLGHHGSRNGTSTELLEYIKPEVAIVTNGDYLGNQYNHPTYEAVKRIYEYSNSIPVFSVTGGNGTSQSRMHQRNGTITVQIDQAGYIITSENYGLNPIELSNTDYWLSNDNPFRNYRYYYADATGILDKVTLKQALHNIIDDHIGLSYAEVWDALRYTDEDPNNKDNVILLYTGVSKSKYENGGNQDDWNREHVWAKSHGGFGETKPAGTDLHHLRPTNSQVNSTRGNLDFDEGGSIVNADYAPGSSFNYVNHNVSFEPRDEVKGDVARMIFYMAVRYEGDKTGEPDLELNDKVNNGSSPYMGKVSTLLKWHKQDAVDNFERNRNNVIYSYQQNRNPFIDFPQFAYLLFANN